MDALAHPSTRSTGILVDLVDVAKNFRELAGVAPRRLLVSIACPFAIWGGRVREHVTPAQVHLLRLVEVTTVRVFTDFDVLTVVWHFPTGFKLVVLTHFYHLGA